AELGVLRAREGTVDVAHEQRHLRRDYIDEEIGAGEVALHHEVDAVPAEPELLLLWDVEVDAAAAVAHAERGGVLVVPRGDRRPQLSPYARAAAEQVDVDVLPLQVGVERAVGELADDPLGIARGQEEIVPTVPGSARARHEGGRDRVPPRSARPGVG